MAHPYAKKLFIWWTNQADAEAAFEKIDQLPEYIQDQLSSRMGRGGRGRLWVPDGEIFAEIREKGIEWVKTECEPYCAEAGGIVITGDNLKDVIYMPGIVTGTNMVQFFIGNIKIPVEIRDNVSAIASHVSKLYGLPQDGKIEMKNDRSDLFQFYIKFENEGIKEVAIEQFNGDEGSYARYSMMQELIDNKTQTFGPTTDCSSDDPKRPDVVETCEHVWVRFHQGDYVTFMQGMCLLIQHTAETHRGRLLNRVSKSLDDVRTYSKMAADLKT